MTTPNAALVDAAARHAIQHGLDRTFLVEAAAGTGKTTALVARVLRVIASGCGQLRSIALLTFTEKAAGEIKLRLRSELDRMLLSPALPDVERERARTALGELETASIGTIHSFCVDLLQRHPVEAEVDPHFTLLAPERERTLLREVFDAWFVRALEDPPEGVRRVLARRSVDPNAPAPDLQLMAAARRLIETRDFDTPFRLPALDRDALVDEVYSELAALAALSAQGRPQDPLARALTDLERALALGTEADEDLDQREALLRKLARDRDLWRHAHGKSELYAPGLPRADVIGRLEDVKRKLDACVRDCDAHLAALLSRELQDVVTAYASEKRETGLLDFFDLLLHTQALLQRVPSVRRALQDSLTHVFVDEFQDTDPVQTEIVLLLCADAPDETDAYQTVPRPGKLFLVGDPKQSIYRFRRADIALYERVKRYLLLCGAELLQLTTSFRALPEIQACINAAFSAAMGGDAGQATYMPLHAFRPSRQAQPAIVALPVPSPYSYSGRITKKAIHQSLPDAIAAFIDWLVRHSGYRVREHDRDVPVAARHVCMLFRRFRDYSGDITQPYLRGLEARGLPHVLSGGRSFHAREEVIALRNLLHAIEWPDDALRVYALLRGPLLGFHDEILFAFKHKLGHLHPLTPVEPTQLETDDERELTQVLALLGELHQRRNRRPIVSTLDHFLSAVRAHAGFGVWPDRERALANVRRVTDLARAYERRGQASSFRGFAVLLEEQASEEQTPEAQVIEEHSDGVRVMTVHAAKGLEFPVVVLCDPTAPARSAHPTHFIDPERKLWAQSLCESEPIELWEQRAHVQEHDAAEIVRLVYVAATRAQELLVLPACGDGPIEGWLSVLDAAVYPAQERRRTPLPRSYALPEFGSDSVVNRPHPQPRDSVAPGEHAPMHGAHRVVFWDPHLLARAPERRGGGVEHMHLLQEAQGPHAAEGTRAYKAFVEEKAATIASAQAPSLRSSSVTAVAHAQGAAPPVRHCEFRVIDVGANRSLRPHGARFGTLVHALFEHGSGAAQPLTALLEHATLLGTRLGATQPEIESAAQSVDTALAHPFGLQLMAAARADQLWHEHPVLLRADDGTLLDGVIDLMFLDSQGPTERICVVDLKTDRELAQLADYEKQLAMYAHAAQNVLNKPAFAVLFWI